MDPVDKIFSLIEIKSIDEDQRIITGIATTPSSDRVNDIVQPKGGKYTLPIPLLWQHNRDEPIGEVFEAKVTSRGIEIKARIVKIDEPGLLKDILDKAWQSIKYKLVRGLSIGFRALKYSYLENGGVDFQEWEWLELSPVTIAANADAKILSVKTIAEAAAFGKKPTSPVKLVSTVGASTKSKSLLETSKMKTPIADQIKASEDTIKQKTERMNELMSKSAEDSRTLDAAEDEEFETLKSDIDQTTKHLKRLRDIQEINENNLTPVEKTGEVKTHKNNSPAIVKTVKNLEKGVEFARFVMAMASCKGNLREASDMVKHAKMFHDSPRVIKALESMAGFGSMKNIESAIMKATVAAGTTLDSDYAAPLVEYNQFAGDFVEFLRGSTIIGRFGQGNIPALRNVPFNINIRSQIAGGTGQWVGQGAPKPVTDSGYANVYLGWTKVAGIAVITEDLARFSNPSAQLLVRDDLANALIEVIDTSFIDPAWTGTNNVSPASVTNAIADIPSVGNDEASIDIDVAAAMSQFINAKIAPTRGVWIMHPVTALNLSLMKNALGQKVYPDINMNGGTFEGLPVITSHHVPLTTDGYIVALLDASEIWLADDGQVTVDYSTEASIQMLDNPTNNSATGTATQMVSMFQTDSIALRAHRFINWKLRRAAAVAVISGVNWGGATVS